MTKYEEKDKDHKKLKAAQEKLEQSKSGKDSAIYKELETAYQKDINKEVSIFNLHTKRQYV